MRPPVVIAGIARTLLAVAFVVVAVGGLVACASPLPAPPAPVCAAGFAPMRSATLYFGTGTPDGVVSPAQWQDFLDAEVTPRFADGFSVWSANGQWRSADGAIGKEASHVLNVVHPADAASSRSLAEIAGAYRERFRQESVLHVEVPACARF